MPAILQIHPTDNVAVALQDLPEGEPLSTGVRTRKAVPRGHKVALSAIAAGQAVLKYGYPIGRASADIAPGEHVHVHNVASHLNGDFSTTSAGSRVGAKLPSPARRSFAGYRRPDGRAAIRNEIWIINTVGCVNQASERIARAAHEQFADKPGSSIDGVFAFPHPFGCS